MAARASQAPFPCKPGDWLRAFRTHCQNHGLDPCTADELGARLGVSGKTVQRWESGRSTPHADDLEAIADFLTLAPQQRAFLLRAFSNVRETRAPVAASQFEERARQILSAPFPALLMDSLYYVRGTNTYARGLFSNNETYRKPGRHFLTTVMGHRGFDSEDAAILGRDWVRQVWLATAPLCGIPAYKRMLDELSAMPGFCDAWLRYALDPEGWRPLGAPVQINRRGEGAFRVYFYQVDFPPVYFLREFVPVDDAAREQVESMRRSGPAGVTFAPVTHWALG